MTFRFIQPESRAFLVTPPAEGAPRPAGHPVRQLGADYRRWSRLLMGAVGLVLALFGVLAAIGIPLSGIRLTAVEIVIAVIGVAVGAVGTWILVRLHRSGQSLLKALAWWTAEPYRTGAARRTAAGWLQARTVNFEPPVFARIVTSALLGLFGILGLSGIFYPVPPGELSPVPTVVATGALFLAVACGQMGGVMHLVSGVAESDPLWARVRKAFRGS